MTRPENEIWYYANAILILAQCQILFAALAIFGNVI
jgi:hypothetical protein